jgi:hypothetical protein
MQARGLATLLQVRGKRISYSCDRRIAAFMAASRTPISGYLPLKNFAAPVIAKAVKSPRTVHKVTIEASGGANDGYTNEKTTPYATARAIATMIIVRPRCIIGPSLFFVFFR